MFQITLRAARVNAGMTQAEAAKSAGVDKATIVNWERGKTSPRIDDIKNLCKIYKIDLNNLILPTCSL